MLRHALPRSFRSTLIAHGVFGRRILKRKDSLYVGIEERKKNDDHCCRSDGDLTDVETRVHSIISYHRISPAQGVSTVRTSITSRLIRWGHAYAANGYHRDSERSLFYEMPYRANLFRSGESRSCRIPDTASMALGYLRAGAVDLQTTRDHDAAAAFLAARSAAVVRVSQRSRTDLSQRSREHAARSRSTSPRGYRYHCDGALRCGGILRFFRVRRSNGSVYVAYRASRE